MSFNAQGVLEETRLISWPSPMQVREEVVCVKCDDSLIVLSPFACTYRLSGTPLQWWASLQHPLYYCLVSIPC